ncbi:MAG: hypothetical protein [Sanya fiers-like virus 46]|nr:MAG: hypothetical protein [Sanya fiers-like virus 46]
MSFLMEHLMSTPVTLVNAWTIDNLIRIAGLPGPFASRVRRLSARGYGVHFVESLAKIHFVGGRDSVGRTVRICQVRPHPVAAIYGPRTRTNPDGLRFIGGEREWVDRDLAWFKLHDRRVGFPWLEFTYNWLQLGNETPAGQPVGEDESGVIDQ